MDKRYDVVVVGGGPSGVAAALGASRTGAKVLLIERYGFIGGMATAGLVGPFMTSFAKAFFRMLLMSCRKQAEPLDTLNVPILRMRRQVQGVT